MVDQGSVPPETSSHQQGLDLEGKEDEVGGEGEDTRLARAFLMGTSRVAFWQGKLYFVSNVSFTKKLSQELRPQMFQMFHSPRNFPKNLRPQRLEE